MARMRTEDQKRLDWLVNIALRGLIRLALLLPYRWRVPLMGWLARHVVAPLAGYTARARDNRYLSLHLHVAPLLRT